MSKNGQTVQAWRQKVKARAIESMGGGCAVCCYNRCSRALTFHHLDPSQKDFGISGEHGRSWDRTVVELRKCVLLCHNCHSEVHEGLITLSDDVVRFNEAYAVRSHDKGSTGRLRKELRHGSLTAYRYYRCRCDVCKAGKAAYKRKWKAKRQANLVTLSRVAQLVEQVAVGTQDSNEPVRFGTFQE